MWWNIAKSILHNIGVTIVSFAVGVLGRFVDAPFGLQSFASTLVIALGLLLLLLGFCIRAWATYLFYAREMKVIELKPQSSLITSGPYRFSRNPLYLGGNVFMFLGASLIFGSISGVVITILGIVATDFMIRREERQLASRFGEEWESYWRRVRRWL